jgi:hypothetical protein
VVQKNFMIYFLNANEWGKCQREDKNTTLKKLRDLINKILNNEQKLYDFIT